VDQPVGRRSAEKNTGKNTGKNAQTR
jgi:hypothetical protein